jgi:hypothetical protein
MRQRGHDLRSACHHPAIFSPSSEHLLQVMRPETRRWSIPGALGLWCTSLLALRVVRSGTPSYIFLCWNLTGWASATGSLFLSGLGIYLGRFRRWNSWQALTEPVGIFRDISDRLLDPTSHPHPLTVTLVFGGGLFLGYAALRLLTFSEPDRSPGC